MCEAAVEGRRAASLMRRKLILWVLTLANCTNFWQRNLLYALASAYPRQCLEACDDAVFVPLCDACDAESCVTCQECRADNDAAFYSLRDASCMSDRQYGLLASVSFTVMFAASGIVAGTIADRFSEERWLHAGAVFVWSIASFAKVVYPDFTVLFATRLVLGVAQGFNAPCAYPVLAYHFSPAERATANGVYSTGTYLGSALSSLSLLAAVYVGWRLATTAAVVVGIFSAALVYLIVERPPKSLQHLEYDEDETVLCGSSNEPRRVAFSVKPGGNDNDDLSITSAWIRVRDNRRLLLLYVATSLRMTTTVALWTYLPTYYGRAFPRDVSAFSGIYAGGTLVCGSTSSAFGGALADAFVRRGYTGAHGFVPAVGTFVSVITVAAALHMHNFFVSVSLLLLSVLLSECWLGPGMGLLARDVPPTTIGTHVSLLLVCNQLLACIGPWAISLADDGTVLGLRRPVIAVASLFSLAAAAAFAVLGAMHTHTAHASSRAGTHSASSNSSSDYRRAHSNNNLVAYTHEEARSLLETSSYIPS